MDLDLDRTFVVPPPAVAVTSEVAADWLRERLPAYLELLAAAGLAQADLETRKALSFLTVDVGRISETCVDAVTTDGTLELALATRDEDPANFDDNTDLLRQVVQARGLLRREGMSEALDETFDELARALLVRVQRG